MSLWLTVEAIIMRRIFGAKKKETGPPPPSLEETNESVLPT